MWTSFPHPLCYQAVQCGTGVELGHVNLLSDARSDSCSKALNTLLQELLYTADASLQNFAAVGVVHFQDDNRGRRHVGRQCFFGCFASVESILLKNDKILQSACEL